MTERRRILIIALAFIGGCSDEGWEAETTDPAGEATGTIAQDLVSGVTCLSTAPGHYCLNDNTTGSCIGCLPGKTLLQCSGKNKAPLSAVTCPAGCVSMPSGQDDYCAVGPAEIDRLMTAAQAAIGTRGGQCKAWVQKLVSSTLPGVSIPTTGANGYGWNPSPHAVPTAQWLATSAIKRIDAAAIAAGGSWSGSVSVANSDPYQVVLYAPSTVTAQIVGVTGANAASVIGRPDGALSGTFTGAGTYVLRIRNTGASTSMVTATVLSRSRIFSAFQRARRGDVIQMLGYFGSESPHTTFVRTDANATPNNFLDSNWCLNDCQIVTQHSVSADDFIRFMARAPKYGFTVYSIR
jgi:hypothetical protein